MPEGLFFWWGEGDVAHPHRKKNLHPFGGGTFKKRQEVIMPKNMLRTYMYRATTVELYS